MACLLRGVLRCLLCLWLPAVYAMAPAHGAACSGTLSFQSQAGISVACDGDLTLTGRWQDDWAIQIRSEGRLMLSEAELFAPSVTLWSGLGTSIGRGSAISFGGRTVGGGEGQLSVIDAGGIPLWSGAELDLGGMKRPGQVSGGAGGTIQLEGGYSLVLQQGGGPSSVIAVVPEPGTYALLLGGLPVLSWRRRKARS